MKQNSITGVCNRFIRHTSTKQYGGVWWPLTRQVDTYPKTALGHPRAWPLPYIGNGDTADC